MLAVRRPDAPHRALSLILVLLLHAFLLFAVLHFLVVTTKSRITAVPEHLLEMFIDTARKPVSAPAFRPAPSPPRRNGIPSPVIPSYVPPVAPPDVTGLGQALFGCAPENIPNLTPDQRAHCTSSFTKPDDNAQAEPKSHVNDPLRREAEMRTKNTPGRLPCTSLAQVQTFDSSAVVPMVDPACAVGGLINGFGSLNGLDK